MSLRGDDGRQDAKVSGPGGLGIRSGQSSQPTVARLSQPPSLGPQGPALGETGGWRKNIQLGIEIVGLVILITYTIFSCLQWRQIRWTNRLTKEALDGNNTSLTKTLEKMQAQIDVTSRFADAAGRSAAAVETANRPYVGVNGTNIVYLGTGGRTAFPTQETQAMRFLVAIKNFGPIPGTSVKSGWRVWVGGVARPQKGTPSKDGTFYPGKTVYMTGGIGGAEFSDVIGGREQLVLEVSVRYAGPKGNYEECEREQFLPSANGFMNLGACTGSPKAYALALTPLPAETR
jgi:hypothetical protein